MIVVETATIFGFPTDKLTGFLLPRREFMNSRIPIDFENSLIIPAQIQISHRGTETGVYDLIVYCI